MTWIADDIYAVILKGGLFYVIRLEDESLNNPGGTKDVQVIFKQKLDLHEETR